METAKVLLIEDESYIAKDISEALVRLGYEVCGVFDNGREAINAIGRIKPDIALVDITIEGDLDGMQTAAKINELITIPIVYLTANQSSDVIEKMTNTHPFGLLLKPVSEKELKTRMSLALYRFETEKRLRESEERYFRLAENARDMIYRMRLPEGIYEYVNNASYQLTGYTPEEFYANPNLISEVIHPDWRHYFQVKWQKLINGEADNYYEFQIIHKSGEVKWLNQRNVLLFNGGAMPVAIEGIVTDVTAQKKSESLIRKQSEEYRSIFDAFPEMVILKDTNNRIIRANKLSSTYFGHKVEEMEGKYLDEFFPDAAVSYLEQDRQIVVTGQPMLGILEKFERPGKGNVWLKFNKYPFRNDTGEIIGIIVMAQDITKEKEFERQLHEAEAQSAALINTIPDLLFQYDREGRHISYKVKDEKDLFVPPEMFLGRNVTEVLPGEVGERFLYFIKKAFETEEIQIYEYELVIDEEIRDFEVRFVKSGEDEALGIVRDVSDRMKVERALRESEEKYKNLVHNAPIALTRYIPNKRIYEFANDELVKQAGFTLDELNAMNDEEFYRQIHDEDRAMVLAEYDKWGLEGFKGIKKLTYRIINKNNKLLWLDSFHYADFNSEGKLHAINQIYIDISERKKAEEALSKSEVQYRNLARNAPVAVTRLVVKERKYDFVNDEFVRQCGYTMDEINEMGAAELVDMVFEEDRRRIAVEYNAWRDSGCSGVKFMEYRVTKKSGDILWLNTYVYAEFSESGELETINQICIDVTDRKEADEAIKQSEEKFRAVTESMRAQIVIFQDERFVYVNPYSEELTGYAKEDLLQMNFWGLMHPEDRDIAKQRGLARQKGENAPSEYEMKIVTKSGGVKWLYYSAVMIKYLGRPAVLGIAFDISDRKKYEEALKKSEERYRAFIDQSFEGIYRIEMLSPISTELPIEEQVNLMNRYSYIAECNEVFTHMMGFKNTSDIAGKRIGELTEISGWDFFRNMHPFVVNNYRTLNEESHEAAKDGRDSFFLNNSVGIIEDGMLHRIWGTRQDITEKKKADDLLKKSLHEKDILLKEIHHRVKNNLQIVSSLLKLQSQYVKDKKTLELFQESQNRVHSMSIIHQKLYQSRDLSNINFGEYVGMLVSHLMQTFGMNPYEFKVRIDAGSLVMSLDNAIPAGLIINELVTNSLKHAFDETEGGGSIEILVTYDDVHNSHKIVVRDNGKGMARDFDISNSSSFGLKLVSMLTNQMNGSVSYKSEKGAEFTVILRNAEYKERS